MAHHDFLLIRYDEVKENNTLDEMISKYCLENNPREYESIKIEDDIILYIMDTLNFFKSTWVSGRVEKGIDYLGYSIIEKKEAYKAKVIFQSWMNMFQLADKEIVLTGEYSWTDGLELKGSYEKIVIDKYKIVNEFKNLANMFNTASKGEYFILHLGI